MAYGMGLGVPKQESRGWRGGYCMSRGWKVGESWREEGLVPHAGDGQQCGVQKRWSFKPGDELMMSSLEEP